MFQAWVDHHAARPGPTERKLIEQVRAAVVAELPGSQVRWAGSQHKGTAITGSDLDLCVETRLPVTEAQRRSLRARLESTLGPPVLVIHHVVRLAARPDHAKVDIAFANAAFGSRPLPDASEFKGRPHRQRAARAMKLWTRAGGLPPVPGWAVEALVVHRDQPPETHDSLALFLRIVEWLADRANPSAVESVLRPASFGDWDEAWSRRLPGQIEALRNAARALQRRPGPASWSRPADVGAWLGQ